MTDLEKKQFEHIVAQYNPEHLNTFSWNWYQVLGLSNFAPYDKNNYSERFSHIKNEIRDLTEKDKAQKCINQAKTNLENLSKKKSYDDCLKKDLLKNLEYTTSAFIKADKSLSVEAEKIIQDEGKAVGLKDNEITEQIEAVLKATGTSRLKKEAHSRTTVKGVPILSIKGETSFSFDQIKLNEIRFATITIINVGGGTLDATASYSKKWLSVTPSKIHQSSLPQTVEIRVDPSKDPGCKNGFRDTETISISYDAGGVKQYEHLTVNLSIEGHALLVDRMTSYSTAFAAFLACFYVLFIFSTTNFSGWSIVGFIISGIALSAGLSSSTKKDISPLIFGGIVLLITSWTVFLAMTPIIITWYVSRAFFEKNPFEKSIIFLIPVFASVPFLIGYLGFSDLNTFKKKPDISLPQNQATSSQIEAINQTGYIKAGSYASIRSGPSVSFSEIARIKKGSGISVIERDRSNGWYKVDFYYNGARRNGYIKGDLISFNKIEPVVAVPKNESVLPTQTALRNKINYPDGSRYEGDQVEGKKEGRGTFYYSKKSNMLKYIGSFKNDLKDGAGILYFRDNTKYEGTWNADKRDGEFIYFNSNGNQEKQIFSNGVRTK